MYARRLRYRQKAWPAVSAISHPSLLSRLAAQRGKAVEWMEYPHTLFTGGSFALGPRKQLFVRRWLPPN